MIIDAKHIIITLIVIAIGAYFGLRFIRTFALSIAQENHDANLAIDAAAERLRLKQEREADAALASAVAKVAPLLPGGATGATGATAGVGVEARATTATAASADQTATTTKAPRIEDV